MVWCSAMLCFRYSVSLLCYFVVIRYAMFWVGPRYVPIMLWICSRYVSVYVLIMFELCYEYVLNFCSGYTLNLFWISFESLFRIWSDLVTDMFDSVIDMFRLLFRLFSLCGNSGFLVGSLIPWTYLIFSVLLCFDMIR